MGWFDEQIKDRKKRDEEDFLNAMDEIAAVITRRTQRKKCEDPDVDRQQNIKRAINEILQYYHVKQREVPDHIKELPDQMDYMCRPCGIMHRGVMLEKGWYKEAAGVYLGTKKDGTFVALIPELFSGYSYYDETLGKKVHLNRKTAEELEMEAICFYKPFPMKKLGIKDLIQFISSCVPFTARVSVMIMMLIITLIGMLTPKITYIIFNDVIPEGNMKVFAAVIIFSVCVNISKIIMMTVKSFIDERISTQMDICVQAAAMGRILFLPPSFFKKYTSGELATILQYLNSLCMTIYTSFMVTGLTSLFSLIYISQVFVYAPTLVIPSIIFTCLTLGASVVNTIFSMKLNKAAMDIAGKKNGMTYEMITGVQKLKLSGAEKRAFARWTSLYAKEVEATYGVPMFVLLGGTINTAISLAGVLVMYFLSVKSGVSVADYYAFTAAYGMVSAAFSSLVGLGLQAARIRPIMEVSKPILEAVPEVSEDKEIVTKISGSIEISHVTFRYEDGASNVLDDVSVKIRPGQYVAVVGKTGCGKSTLLRILLGFETVQKGAVYYDGKDISKIDLKSLRKNIGVVTQDGKLFQGDIFSNIVISAPWLSMEDAWEAAEVAGIADDIRDMPMGMSTMISEGSGGISGGQKQRLMIARAVAPKPKVLMFDEATSALDNITQKKISAALDKLNCTRIVIAHRLSTIRQCDRIIVLDGGKIVEDGTYEELLENKGFFAELVERQKVG